MLAHEVYIFILRPACGFVLLNMSPDGQSVRGRILHILRTRIRRTIWFIVFFLFYMIKTFFFFFYSYLRCFVYFFFNYKISPSFLLLHFEFIFVLFPIFNSNKNKYVFLLLPSSSFFFLLLLPPSSFFFFFFFFFVFFFFVLFFVLLPACSWSRGRRCRTPRLAWFNWHCREEDDGRCIAENRVLRGRGLVSHGWQKSLSTGLHCPACMHWILMGRIAPRKQHGFMVRFRPSNRAPGPHELIGVGVVYATPLVDACHLVAGTDVGAGHLAAAPGLFAPLLAVSALHSAEAAPLTVTGTSLVNQPLDLFPLISLLKLATFNEYSIRFAIPHQPIRRHVLCRRWSVGLSTRILTHAIRRVSPIVFAAVSRSGKCCWNLSKKTRVQRAIPKQSKSRSKSWTHYRNLSLATPPGLEHQEQATHRQHTTAFILRGGSYLNAHGLWWWWLDNPSRYLERGEPGNHFVKYDNNEFPPSPRCCG